MIDIIEVENIRAFKNKSWSFDLKPITVFCGSNSAGKSTIIKSLLLLQQSQAAHETELTNQAKLRFAGPQVDLGSYRSLVSDNDIQKNISITIGFKGRIPYPLIDGLVDPSAQQEQDSHPYTLNSKFTFASHTENKSTSETKSDPKAASGMLYASEFALLLEPNKPITWKVELREEKNPSNPVLHLIHIPSLLIKQSGLLSFVEISSATEKKTHIVQVALKGLIPSGMSVRLRKPPPSKAQSKEASRTVQVPLPGAINRPLYDLRTALTHIHYIGPLRAPAKRYYVANLESPPGLDSSGEFLPYVLRENTDTLVDNATPKTWEISQTTLAAALNCWLQYLRTGDTGDTDSNDNEINVSHTKGVLVEFKLKDSPGNSQHSLIDSGFGYSQILPIIVRGLLAPAGSTLIIEQPELHLNPALQVRLAEFFIAMMKVGKQVIIETHSEHIVNSIRVLAAEEPSDDIASNSSIYYIESQADAPVVHTLSIQSDGTVPRWPRHFFGEALTLSGRLLSAQRSKRSSREAQ